MSMSAVDMQDALDMPPDGSDMDVAAPDMPRDMSVHEDMDQGSSAAGLVDSPSALGHFSLDRRAAVTHAGPTSEDVVVQTRDFEQVTGEQVGTSPWHVLSAKRYASPRARTVWGASLEYAYKFVIDGDDFTFASIFEIAGFPTSITWNIMGRADGSVIVPDPDGFRAGPDGNPCEGTLPALLVFRDDMEGTGDPMSPIECVGKFEFEPGPLRELCAAPAGSIMSRGPTGASMAAAYTGEVVTTVVFSSGGEQSTYMLVLDETLTEPVACGLVAVGTVSNEPPVERLSEDVSALYYPMDDAIVKMAFDASSRSVERVWRRAFTLRRRTGTTPTLVDTPDGERFVVLIDSTCATSNVVNGLLVCDEADEPSRLIAVRRADDTGGAPEVLSATLPAAIRAVENSPAAHEGTVVVADYSGYLPNGLVVPPGGQDPGGGVATWGVSPDSVAEFAMGLVAMT